MMRTTHLTIVGAGVIGLSCAWSSARTGTRVTVVDPTPCSGASWVAGGMLAPVTEAWPGEEPLLELGTESLRRWPMFAARLAADAGADPGVRDEGTLVVATGAGDRTELAELARFLAKLGRDVESLTGRELRRREPALGPDVRGGLAVPGDLAVDNRALLAALRTAASRAGVTFVAAAASAVAADRVELDDGRVLEGGQVLVAAGAHSGRVCPALDGLVRPVKGEVLRLRHRAGALPPPSRTVRALVDGRHAYLVPRDGGGLVLGATQLEAGFDTDVTAGGVRDLLRDAERVLPAITEYALEEASAGLRPGSPDNLPLIGRLPDGPLVATGHGRNGILLAPVTADAVLALLAGGPVPEVASVADPARLSGRAGWPGPSRSEGRAGRSVPVGWAGPAGRVEPAGPEGRGGRSWPAGRREPAGRTGGSGRE